MLRPLVACLLPTLLFTAASAADTRTATDRSAGVHFRLAGERLTARLIPRGNRVPPDARGELWGKRVRAVCVASFDPRAARAVSRARDWPSGRMRLGFRFRRDISSRVKWCLLERVSGGDIAVVDFERFIKVTGTSMDDRRIGLRLRRYLQRNARHAPWYLSVNAIVVDRGVIAVVTRLRKNRRGRRAAAALCALIQGADVADFTPGHTIFGRDDVRLRVCPARQD
jgi:hypothetical protein